MVIYNISLHTAFLLGHELTLGFPSVFFSNAICGNRGSNSRKHFPLVFTAIQTCATFVKFIEFR